MYEYPLTDARPGAGDVVNVHMIANGQELVGQGIVRHYQTSTPNDAVVWFQGTISFDYNPNAGYDRQEIPVNGYNLVLPQRAIARNENPCSRAEMHEQFEHAQMGLA